MKTYLFVFGRNPELSFLELTQFLSGRNISYKIFEAVKEIAVVQVENIPEDLANILGGTVRIGEVIARNIEGLEKNSFDYFNKMQMSICVYSNSQLYEPLRNFLKKKAKEEHIKYLLSKDTAPSKIREGFEILLFKDHIAKTVSIFHPQAYKERDKRPCNDFLKNTSIRLSRILIHLSGKPSGTLLDPFCWTGVILQEGVLLGYDVLGLDADEKSVQCSRKNLFWIQQKYKTARAFKVQSGNALTIPYDHFDVIVSEPYLGPYIRGILRPSEAEKIKRDLERLYIQFFRNLGRCRVVFILPRFQLKNKILNLERVFGDFKILHGPLLYADENSKIIREIYVLEK